MSFYDRYFQQNNSDKSYNMAGLAMSIPGSPDPEPALQWFRITFSDSPSADASAQRRWLDSSAARGKVYLASMRLENVLSLQGRMEDARWVKQLRAKQFNEKDAQHYYAMRAASKQLPGGKIRLVSGNGAGKPADRSSWTHEREKASRAK